MSFYNLIRNFITQGKIVLFILFLLSFNTVSQEVEPVHLPVGLWEGIDQYQYKLLEINADGQHKLFKLNIASGFSKGTRLLFTDNDIKCNETECAITILKANQNNDIDRLLITPYLDTSFNVLEINADPLGKPVLTSTYQLDKQNNQSTPREFIQKYKKRIKALTAINNGDIYGFWIGVLMLDKKPELISLEIHPDKTSYFVRFINGGHSEIKASFEPEKMTILDSTIHVETNQLTFANKLIIHQLNKGMLSGYMYSVYKGHALENGQFSLFRLKLYQVH